METLYFLIICLVILFIILWAMSHDDMNEEWYKEKDEEASKGPEADKNG